MVETVDFTLLGHTLKFKPLIELPRSSSVKMTMWHVTSRVLITAAAAAAAAAADDELRLTPLLIHHSPTASTAPILVSARIAR